MNKKIYKRPHLCVVYTEMESLLASVSGGVKGKTYEFQGDEQQPNIGFGGDAVKKADQPEDEGYEVW